MNMLNNSQMISIIMPVHNTEQYIKHTVESVLQQNFENFELICLVNNSTDASEEILLELANTDSRIIVVKNTDSASGTGPARNQGVEMSKGKFITFLDDDDYLEVDFLERLYEMMIKYDVDVVQSAIRYVFKNSTKNISYGSGIILGEQASVRINMADGLASSYPMVCGKLYKKHLFDNVKMKAIRFEDIEFTPRLYENVKSVYLLDEHLYNYNKRYSKVTNWSGLKASQFDEYFDGLYESIVPYFSESAMQTREKYELNPSRTVFANVNNLVRGINIDFYERSEKCQGQFEIGYKKFTDRVQTLLSEKEWAWFSQALTIPIYKKNKLVNKYLRGLPISGALKRAKTIIARVRRSNRPVRIIERLLPVLDPIVPKNQNIWMFSSWAYYPAHTLDNPRGIFEQVKDNPKIKKVISVHGKFNKNNLTQEGINVVFVPIFSVAAMYYLLRAGVFFTGNALSPKFGYRNLIRRPKRRKIVQLWHAITLKKIGLTLSHNLELYWKDDANRYALVTSTSKLDQKTMTESFSPNNPDAVQVTGIPRHDLLLMPEDKLPSDYKEHLKWVQKKKAGKKLVLYAPTWRGALDDKSEMTIEQMSQLDKLCEKYNVIFGQRLHLNSRKNTKRSYFSDNVLNLDGFTETAILLREVDALITDYSSIYFDIMQRDKPAILYQVDMESYGRSRGLPYQPDQFRPHEEIIDSFDKLYDMLEGYLSSSRGLDDRYTEVKARFMQHNDHNNAQRVIEAMEGR